MEKQTKPQGTIAVEGPLPIPPEGAFCVKIDDEILQIIEIGLVRIPHLGIECKMPTKIKRGENTFGVTYVGQEA